jgi:hypothetical protein
MRLFFQIALIAVLSAGAIAIIVIFGPLMSDPAPGPETAIRLSRTGKTEVLIDLCHQYDDVQNFALLRSAGAIGRSGDEILWEFKSSVSSASVSHLVLGDLPSGYTQVASYRAPEPGTTLVIEIETAAGFSIRDSFTPSELRSDLLFINAINDDRFVSEEEYFLLDKCAKKDSLHLPELW